MDRTQRHYNAPDVHMAEELPVDTTYLPQNDVFEIIAVATKLSINYLYFGNLRENTKMYTKSHI
ncbi:hypothetical protein ABE504_12955 [Paenibacillus oryzisoli]|uniref:hypothetical protein n=1 Tax=Paenibacillus oryzisoli TaxID=1850517 RepID=UPI003D27E926